MPLPSRRLSKGFSLIEILLVIGIIAILSIAAFVIYQQVSDSNQANTETSHLTSITAGVRNLFAIRADYVGLTTGVVNQAHIFPIAMNGNDFSPTREIMHSGNGTVEIIPYGDRHQYFAIIYNNVPAELCARIAQTYSQNTEQVWVNDTIVKDFGMANYDPTLAITQCNEISTSQIIFVQK